ncbi:MAG TPA: hypothetical protein VGD87_14455, partial [Archangium sp.]
MRSALLVTLLVARLASAGDELDLPPAPNELTTKRLDFKGGAPLIPVRLMEGSAEVTLVGRGRMRFRLPGTPERLVEGPPGMAWKIRRVSGAPAKIVARIQVAEIPFNDKLGLAQAQDEWAAR